MTVLNLKWSKADAKRAHAMGWRLDVKWIPMRITNALLPDNSGFVFKTDRDAAWWVMWHAETGINLDGLGASKYPELIEEKKTCRKALLLCALGGQS